MLIHRCAASHSSEFKGHATKPGACNSDSEAVTIYLLFIIACALVSQMFEGVGLSTLPTLSVSLHTLALGFLWSKVQHTRNAMGISAKSLMMQALVHGLRLCSTTWLKGYIPADATGDWLYQAMDALTLVLCLKLAHVVVKKHGSTYQVELDDFDIKPVVAICFALAIVIHPDLNDRIVFDAIWATSLYVDVVAMMPQLWLMSKSTGSAESMTGHYVAAVALSRACSLCFWTYGYVELAPLDGGKANVAGYAILIAHILQVVLFCDFMYYYIRNWMQTCRALCNANGEPLKDDSHYAKVESVDNISTATAAAPQSAEDTSLNVVNDQVDV